MLRVFGYAASINVRKVLWTCEELDLPFEREDWGGPGRATSEPEFRAMSPVGLVPVIDDDGVVLWESNVIVRYLAASRGRLDLVPADPARRARIESWMDWQASDFNNSWRVAFQGLVRRNPDFQDPVAIARSAASFAAMAAIVDAQLARTGAYIAGASFTVADVAIGLSIHRWFATPVERPRLENLDRYYDLLCSRPGFRRYGRDGGP